MSDYEAWEQECGRIRNENKKLLQGFCGWLSQKNISEKLIQKHRLNTDFYINEFLLYDDATDAKDGSHLIGMFLGYWFIKKAMWASASTIRESARSLKQFYQFLYEKGDVNKQSIDALKERIKSDMPEWLETLRRYDDPSIDDPEKIWGL